MSHRQFDRLAGGARPACRYRDALKRTVHRGAGSILAIPDDPSWFTEKSGSNPDEDLELLRSHSQTISRGAKKYVEREHLNDLFVIDANSPGLRRYSVRTSASRAAYEDPT